MYGNLGVALLGGEGYFLIMTAMNEFTNEVKAYGVKGGEGWETEVGAKKDLSPLEVLECQSGAAALRNGQVCVMGRPIRRRVLGGEHGAFCYHVMTRTCGAERILDVEDLEGLRIIIRKLALFSGVKVMTYCLLENHFHLLVRVPSREKFLRQFEDRRGRDGVLTEVEGSGEGRLIRHLATLYSKAYIKQLQVELADMRERGLDEMAEAVLERYKRRFCNLSLYVKEVKERFSRWYNRKHQRVGTMWSGRFKSVLVEDGDALRTMAAYIDLNPVRAGIVEDPKDYRWCGYAEAVAGGRQARRGLCMVMGKSLDGWSKKGKGKNSITAGAWYRCWLMQDGKPVEGDERSKVNHVKIRKGIPEEIVDEALKHKGQLTAGERLLSRVKYLTEGAAIGSEGFVKSFYRQYQDNFGPGRDVEAKRMAEDPDELKGLYSLQGVSCRE